MDTLPALLRSKRLNFASGMLLAWAWGMFSYAHALAFQRSGDWTYLLFCASETLAAALFLLRSEAVTVSLDPGDWLLAIGATFAPFFFNPSAGGILPEARYALVPGILIQIAGLISLNRSYGLVAAKRRIKTGGMYRLVRHPMYASYLLSFTAYVLANTSAANVLTYVLTLAMLGLRMLREERHLGQDADYRAYMGRVKYRVLPWIF
ncbi:methyltransferase family protein [Janthinobacterium fluminis]|uniref:Methyltransferase n=1 Tax=Janthinobacterium fluminis TaxID=2987524 RepID=A0ABT5K3C2_9BURK|nr:methyltransferase [Janthinobacterium fluminis]MDC8759246.1 methyltransferase [Janthinobacterium fluminis]